MSTVKSNLVIYPNIYLDGFCGFDLNDGEKMQFAHEIRFKFSFISFEILREKVKMPMNFITLQSKEWIIHASQYRYALFHVLSRLWATCYIFIEVKSWPRAYTSLVEWVYRFFCPRNNSSTLEREYTYIHARVDMRWIMQSALRKFHSGRRFSTVQPSAPNCGKKYTTSWLRVNV